MITYSAQQSKLINEIVSDDIITPKNVKVALSFHSDYFRARNPLENLMLVKRHIVDSMFPECNYAYKIALAEVLGIIIMDELLRLRRFMEIPYENGEHSISEVSDAIVEDGKTRNAHLIGWSWLYYGYIHKELCITQQKFGELLSLDDRTIRRYESKTIERLTELIIDKEWKEQKFHVLAQEAILKKDFTDVELQITLKPYVIFKLLQSDQSLLRAFMKLVEVAKKEENILLDTGA
jgi:hypothetical protein